MKTTSKKIDNNLSIVTTQPSKKDLACFNGNEWEYKGKKYKTFEEINLVD